MKLKKIEQIITITVFGLIIILLFNEPINDFIGLQTSSEITLLAKIGVLVLFLIIALIAPFAMGTEEVGQ